MHQNKVEDIPITKTRFSDATWAKTNHLITIGGVGGIGSWLALDLARGGQHELFLYDDDTVEATNLAGQFYGMYDIDNSKVNSIRRNINTFCDSPGHNGNKPTSPTTTVYNEKYTEDSPTTPVMFSCFDNMKARKIMFENWLKDPDKEIFIDGRMIMEMGEIYTVINTAESIAKYRETLFDDDDVPPLACSSKATTHNGAIIAGYMISILNNYTANKIMNIDMRSVPSRLDYDLMTFSFNIFE